MSVVAVRPLTAGVVAEVGGQVVGTACWYGDVPTVALVVVPEHAGTSTEMVLLRSLHGAAVDAGIPRLVVTLADDDPRRPLYERLGYVDQGVKDGAPFMTLSFLALSVIPSLKITDRGLVDVDRFELVPLSVKGP